MTGTPRSWYVEECPSCGCEVPPDRVADRDDDGPYCVDCVKGRAA